MKQALKNGTLDLPVKYEAARSRFERIIAEADRRPPIRDASKEVVVRLKKQVMISPEFTELWDRIKQKTTYRVNIDTERLIEVCADALSDMPPIPKARIVSKTADIRIENAGVRHFERGLRTDDIADSYQYLPDIITIISDAALLTPATVNSILVKSGPLGDFLNNPEAFLESAVEIIRDKRHAMAIDGISYIRLEGREYFYQQIFTDSEFIANLERNAVRVDHSVYDHIIYDSGTIELPFAVALDNDPDVKMFFKIPSSFTIDTPIGTYNPDWAVYLTKNGEEKLFFVIETKGSEREDDLRARERMKINCGKKHFRALDDGVEMRVSSDWEQFKMKL